MADIALTIDTSGMACPMPIVKTKLAINKLESGQVLELISTDRGSKTDVPAWCESTRNRLISEDERDSKFVYLIEKA
jgi:tRNA 2-thiouridine synthesizing protein A